MVVTLFEIAPQTGLVLSKLSRELVNFSGHCSGAEWIVVGTLSTFQNLTSVLASTFGILNQLPVICAMTTGKAKHDQSMNLDEDCH